MIDRQKIGARQVALVVICATVMACDGFDLYMLGMLAPAIAEGLAITPESLAIVFVGQQLGTVIGAFGIGLIADRVGRRWPFIICIFLLSVGTLLVVGVTRLEHLLVLRFLTGIFLGAVMPMAVSLVSEWMPARLRATAVTFIFTGYIVGTAGGAIVAKWLLSPYGWQVAFWAAGLIPLATLPFVLAFVPESLRFLAQRDVPQETLRRAVQRALPSIEIPAGAQFVSEASGLPARRGNFPSDMAVWKLFGPGFLLTTALLWVTFITSMTVHTMHGAWMPTFFQQRGGTPIEVFANAQLLLILGAVLGMASSGRAIDKFGPANIFIIYALGAALAAIGLGFTPFGTHAFSVVIFAWGFFGSSIQGSLNSLSAMAYPTDFRTTGVGWAIGVARLGSLVGVPIGAAMLAAEWSLEHIFMATALPLLLIGLTGTALARSVRKRELLIKAAS